MEFKSLKNIETSFDSCVCSGLSICVYARYLCFFPYGRLTLLRKRNGRRSMFWMKEKSLMLALSQDLE